MSALSAGSRLPRPPPADASGVVDYPFEEPAEDEEDDDVMPGMQRRKGHEGPRKECPYLDTINRHVSRCIDIENLVTDLNTQVCH